MMEAEVSTDRIGIMAKGRLRCIGTSAWLKERFGTGYVTPVKFSKVHSNVLTEDSDNNAKPRKAVKLFFRQCLHIAPREEKSSLLTFIMLTANEETLFCWLFPTWLHPLNPEPLEKDFFEELESRVREFGIRNIQLGLGTLEDVFLNIAKNAELETATPSQNMNTKTLASGGSLKGKHIMSMLLHVQLRSQLSRTITHYSTNVKRIPLGARHVKIPGTESRGNPHGIMVEVFWKQDDAGKLCISKHSEEKPVPPTLQPTGSSSGNVSAHRKSIGIQLERVHE